MIFFKALIHYKDGERAMEYQMKSARSTAMSSAIDSDSIVKRLIQDALA